VIGLFLSLALAQDAEAMFAEACDIAYPISGTAGFANGRRAARINANTYAAGAFARRRIRRDVIAAMDGHSVYGVAKVPSYCDRPDARRADQIYAEPLDLHATNLGFNVPVLEGDETHARVFYASSVTTSTHWHRVGTAMAPLFNLYPASFAPLVGSSSTGQGLGTYTVDWIGGVSLRSPVVSVQAGYTGQRGVYADVTQEKVALFVNGVIDQLGDGFDAGDLAYWMGGLQELDLATVSGAPSEAGMTSLYARSIPLAPRDPERPGLQLAPSQILRTGHLEQHDLWHQLDVHMAWQFGGEAGPALRELSAAWHNEGWVPRKGRPLEEGTQAYLRAGIVHIPAQPLRGVKGGLYPLIKGVMRVANNEDVDLKVVAQLNDPALLDLYPFGVNAFGLAGEISWRLPE
jgi:hypothetical protein